ncbi:hypothetical protein MY1884_004078 [Beauveria asiatica]
MASRVQVVIVFVWLHGEGVENGGSVNASGSFGTEPNELIHTSASV